MIKTCERCKLDFECKADQIEDCACNKILLNPKQREVLQGAYNDCLCNDCLEIYAKLKFVEEQEDNI
jgi:hypothetical protein